MRFSLRKESFPIWDLAPSDVKEGDSVVECRGLLLLLAALRGTKAEQEVVATAATAAKNAMLRLGNMVLFLQLFSVAFPIKLCNNVDSS